MSSARKTPEHIIPAYSLLGDAGVAEAEAAEAEAAEAAEAAVMAAEEAAVCRMEVATSASLGQPTER
jgi:hypothetical protein